MVFCFYFKLKEKTEIIREFINKVAYVHLIVNGIGKEV